MMSEKLMLTIERAVCAAVNVVLHIPKERVSESVLYTGKTNIPFARALARNTCFHVMHFHFGFSYTVIAQRSGMGVKSVMRCVRKYHLYSRYDRSYKKVYELLKEGLLHEG